MIDNYLIKFLNPLFIILGSVFLKFRINANLVSLLGLFFSFGSFFLILNLNFILALFFFLLGRIMDGVDGSLANRTGKTDFGGFLDIVFDFISYSLVPLAFILILNSNAFFGSILLATFFGTGSTFLALAIFEGKKSIYSHNKSFFHVGGLIGGSVTILFLSLMMVFPYNFNLIAIVFSILCIIGTIERIFYAYNILNNK
ncbi:MAG: hypothetical protein CMN37_04660 [SAR116 cluster bacterium]|nr:hypothetical protein [SAR116 cluster bacterium]